MIAENEKREVQSNVKLMRLMFERERLEEAQRMLER